MTPDQIVAIVLALTSPQTAEPLFPVIAAGGADPRYPIVASPCPRPLAPYEVEGRTVACGKVSVPKNHAEPEGRRISLTFMIFKSRSLSPAPDAVVHLHGGPGGGIIEDVGLTSIFFEQMRARRDVVAFDQRGVDTSAGPDSRCFETVAADPVALAEATRGSGDTLALTRKLTTACLDEIKANGADITTINTQQNARDVSAVMHTLGYPAYNIYGASYGTKLGQEVMRSAPAGLRAVVLDSVAPVQVSLYDTVALPHAEAIQSTFDACKADLKCDAAYPDLQKRYWSLWSKIDAAPLRTPQGQITSDDLYDLLDSRNSLRSKLQGVTSYVPKIIAELETGEGQTYFDIKSGRTTLQPTPDSALSGLSGLDPDSRAFAELALRRAQIGKQNDQAVASALSRLDADRAASASGTGLVDEFESALLDAARALDEQARPAFAADYLRLRVGKPTPEALSAMLGRHFEGDSLARLDALLGVMNLGQVEEVFGRIGKDNKALDHVLFGDFQLQMFACQEDMDNNSPAGAAAVSSRLRAEFGWPEKMTKPYEDWLVTRFFPLCGLFKPHPRPGYHDPVTSPIPTLVLQGALDTQTAPSWGALMASTLPRGQFAFFPESGHGTLLFSQCSRDISAAFLENPEARVDTSCTMALVPSFVLPDGSRSK